MRALGLGCTAVRPPHAVGLAVGVATALLALAACDKESSTPEPSAAAAAVAPSAPPAAPEPPRAPDIVVDTTTVAVGNDRVATGEPGLADKVAVFVTGRPAIAGAAVSVVAMRGAKPGPVAAVVAALRKAGAGSVVLRTEARDGTTQKLPVSFPTAALPGCAAVAWIARDAAIDVWPAGGGTARRIVKGLAGPDMTLGGEAVRKQLSGCDASALYVGADDVLTWGLVFDLATGALTAPGARVSSVVLVTSAVPGRKLAPE